jgi:spore maturation protein CgeB
LFPGEHFIAWNTPKEARKISEYYLDTNSGRDEAEEIAECGERWVLDRYRPIHSARKMLEVIGV